MVYEFCNVLSKKNYNIRAKEEYLRDLSDSFNIKDILEAENIRCPLKIRELLGLLSFQVGSQVSIHALCKQLVIYRETTERLWP